MYRVNYDSLRRAAEIIASQKVAAKFTTPILDVFSYDGINKPQNQYEVTFAPFLGSSFWNLLHERKKEGQSTQVLDLFGGGYFLENLDPVDSLTAVRLCNIDDELVRRGTFMFLACQSTAEEEIVAKRQSALRNLRESKKRFVLKGNLYSNSTWVDLEKHMATKRIPSFDLIICRPELAFRNEFLRAVDASLDAYSIVFAKLFKRATTLLSQTGVLYTQVPEFIDREQLELLKDEYEIQGIHILIEPSSVMENQRGFVLEVTRI